MVESSVAAGGKTASGSRKTKALKRGAIRDNLEAFGVAILAAVLLKYFAIEAFQIPTSSMQPTMMGSTEAGVYDRLLVDKIHYAICEPRRWDIMVFHYPLQKNQNYVKRCVGLPDDKLHIAGGNLYLVKTAPNGQPLYEILRKPPHIQAGLWKEVYPMRVRVRDDAKVLGNAFFAQPRQNWSESDELLTATMESGRPCRLEYTDDKDGGMVDRVWDGYPLAIEKKMRELHENDQQPQELVPDVKFEVGLAPTGTLEECAFEIEVLRPNLDPRTYALVIKAGKGQLQVRKDTEVLASSPQFDCPVPAGATTPVGFARLDDMLYAWRDGKELQTLDVAGFPTLEGCELSQKDQNGKVTSSQSKATPTHKVRAQILAKGNGRLELHDLRLFRDLHYTQDRAPDVIEVPAGHYFMMGDNTLQSVDSRGWTAFKVGLLPDGSMVPPAEAEQVPGGRVVRGNKRPVPPSMQPDRDETPIVFSDRNEVVMIDEYGEILKMKSGISPSYPSPFMFQKLGSADARGDWEPPEEKVPFVPRQDIVGRALLGFWPIWPFGPNRFGPIK